MNLYNNKKDCALFLLIFNFFVFLELHINNQL